MSVIKREQDIETLRTQALLLEDHVDSLMRQNAELLRENNELKGGSEKQLELELAKVNQELARLRQKTFGDSSEKRPKWKSSGKKNKKKTGHGPRPQPDLPISVELLELPEEEQVCDSCGGELQVWDGQVEESKEITLLTKTIIYKQYQRQKYRCRCGGCIKTAPPPKKLQAGSLYSIDFAVDVAVSKYADHLPLERQVRILSREGLRVDSQTLWDQIDVLAKHRNPFINGPS